MDFSALMNHPALARLLTQQMSLVRLNRQLQALLPASVAQSCKIAAVQKEVLIIQADHSLCANRLRLLLPTLWPKITEWLPVTRFEIKIRPVAAAPQQKTFRLPEKRLDEWAHAAAEIERAHADSAIAALLRRVLARQQERR